MLPKSMRFHNDQFRAELDLSVYKICQLRKTSGYSLQDLGAIKWVPSCTSASLSLPYQNSERCRKILAFCVSHQQIICLFPNVRRKKVSFQIQRNRFTFADFFTWGSGWWFLDLHQDLAINSLFNGKWSHIDTYTNTHASMAANYQTRCWSRDQTIYAVISHICPFNFSAVHKLHWFYILGPLGL